MVGQERTNLATSMYGAAIPQQVDGTAEVAEQMSEEGADVETRQTSRPAPEIERQSPPSGRHGEPAAHRQAIVAQIRYRGEHVEFRLEQHREALAERLAAEGA